MNDDRGALYVWSEDSRWVHCVMEVDDQATVTDRPMRVDLVRVSGLLKLAGLDAADIDFHHIEDPA